MGLVRSAANGEPVPARLDVLETRGTAAVDSEGLFSVDVPEGTYNIRIAAQGYLSQTKLVTVKAGDRAIFNVDLHPQ
jgi:hypothetical protein